MDATMEHYIHMAVGVAVAAAVMSMIIACLNLRRQAKIEIETKNYYEKQLDYRRSIEDISNGEVSALRVLGLVTMHAEELDIYIDKLANTYSGYSLTVNSENRANIWRGNLAVSVLQEQFIWANANADIRSSAIGTAPLAASTLGKALTGNETWVLTIMYDGNNVTQEPPAGNGVDGEKRITGLRFIKK